MIDKWIIVTVVALYFSLLFGIAYWGDFKERKARVLNGRPTIYALTLAVYCTSWTFFGSVGFAAATGLNFLAVYLGPIIAFLLAMPLLRHVTRVCKAQNITSIADFISARYGKNPAVAGVVAVVAIAGTLPYLALQLKAISQSVSTLVGHLPSDTAGTAGFPVHDVQLAIAIVLAGFTILFGARHSDVTEHQRGLMLAIAVESVVKLAAFLAVGIYIVFFIMGGVGPLARSAVDHPAVLEVFSNGFQGNMLLTVTFLSFVCIFVLPRQFHVTFVENVTESELRRASWLFPMYLVLINIFVVPVAIAGLIVFSKGSVSEDMFLLALPLHADNRTFTLIAFLGGLSAATAMVVVETVALSIMVCNDLVMPLLLSRPFNRDGRDMSRVLLHVRRGAILVIVLLAYTLYEAFAKAPLASIGLLSFVAIAQFGPAFFGGLFWRRATARGAIAGIAAGFAVWVYTLLIPYLIDADIIGQSLRDSGPFGLTFLRPQMLFYFNFDFLIHGVVWSIFFNLLAFVTVSLLRPPEPIERLQASLFIHDNTPAYTAPPFRPWRAVVTLQDLIATVSRYLGTERTQRSFNEYAASRGIALIGHIEADIHAVRFTENLLASAIGAASSRLVMSLTLRRRNVGVNSALKLLDDASEAIQYNRDLLQTALDHVRQGLAVFDKDMRLICWNRQFRDILSLPPQLGRFGIPLDEIIRYMAQRARTDRTAVEQMVTDRVTKYVVSMETFHERLIDGRVVEVRTNAMPQGGIVVTYMDITERVIAADALARAKDTLEKRVATRTSELTAVNVELELAKAKADEANIGKTRFLAAASHDILQPLNAARLYATSLMERAPQQEFARLARNIDVSLEAVEDILSALSDISRLDTGAMKPEFATFPVNELFEQLRIDFEPVAKARGLTFTIVPSGNFVLSDRRLLRRVMQNLVSNALKYTDQGGVVLGCRRRDGKVLLQVCDTGPGIASSEYEKIFKEFERLNRNTQNVPGLGLGLSIVERMCRVLDHPISLQSRLGRGSSFNVALPKARWTEIETVRPYGLRPAPYGDLRHSVILCIDNERSILDGMRTLLSGWQCTVLTAMNEAEALAQINAATFIPDVIVSDYHLDDTDGLTAALATVEAVKADIPIVIVTADRSLDIRAKVMAAGAAILYKPIKPAALRALLAQIISRRQAAE